MTVTSVPLFSKLMFTLGPLTSLFIILSRISNVKAANDSDSDSDGIGSGLRENYQTSALKEHNSFRYLHRAPPLVLDYKLNMLARKCARYYARKGQTDSTCPHKNDTTESSLGENLALDNPTNFEFRGDKSYRKNADIAVDTVTRWYDELTKYKFLKPGYTSSAKHFTQMVWRNCTKFGFGIYRDQTSSRVYIVALYDPPGNTMGNFEENVKRRRIF